MGERIIPAVPEQRLFDCDGCGAEDIKVVMRVELVSEDYQGNPVHGVNLVFCPKCRRNFVKQLPTYWSRAGALHPPANLGLGHHLREEKT